jgi:HK97 family phage prohead protease
VLGRLSAGTLRASVDRRGLLVEIDPDPDIQDHASLLRSIKRGDITGMSFSFQTMPEGDKWDQRTTPPTREVLDMKVFEVSVVAMPAYEATDVEVALRSRARAFGQVRTLAELRAVAEAKAAAWRR